jgi:tetratricopeptide (TPR) repeat protein
LKRAVGAAALIVALTLPVQLFSDGVFGSLAESPSLPRALASTWPFAFAHATGLERFAAVRLALARGALLRNDTATAATLVAPLGDRPDAVEVRARVALARGEANVALRDFVAVGDFSGARATIDALALHDPVAALAVIRDFDARLQRTGDAPEDTAEVEWREGQIAAAAALAVPAHAPAYRAVALDAYRRALVRAPNEEKYLLNYAFEALRAGEPREARSTYVRATHVVPDSVDAFLGVAVSAAVTGDCATARDANARAQAFAQRQHRAADPAAAGYAPAVRAAYARCMT